MIENTRTLADLVNADEVLIGKDSAIPVLATPAAFVAGVVAGGKACSVLVGAAVGGAAVGKAVAS